MTHDPGTETRLLTPADARLYQDIRLEALQAAPEAFGSTYELERAYAVELKSGDPDEVVEIRSCFGGELDFLWDGLDIRADSVVERWDRQDAEEVLGDRLKI